jgi:hypothetical protein
MPRHALAAACTLLAPLTLAAQAGVAPARSRVELATQATFFILDLGSAGAPRSAGNRGVTFRAAYRPASHEGALAAEVSYAELESDAATHPVRSPLVRLASVGVTRWMRPQEGRQWTPTGFATIGAGIVRLARRPSATCRVGTGCVDVPGPFEYAEATYPVLVLGFGGALPLWSGLGVRADLRGHFLPGDKQGNDFTMRVKPEVTAGAAWRF